MINVWVTEQNKTPYCLIERATDRQEALESLNETILTSGVVPAWIGNIKFYEWGDIPTETYQSGDTIEIR